MKCPFCAEEIKDEAIVCKHCHTNLAEEDKRAVMEHEAAAVEMTECESICSGLHARVACSWAFTIAWAAFGLWLSASNAIQMLDAYLSEEEIPAYVFNTAEIFTRYALLCAGICAYVGWSMFWGTILVRPVIRRFASSLFVFGNGLIDLILRVIGIWLFCELILIPLVGTVVGGLGGALYMLGKHMKLQTAYRSHIASAKVHAQVTTPV